MRGRELKYAAPVSYTHLDVYKRQDMGNTPRVDPQTMQGFITDVATKRRLRNYIASAYEGEPGMEIIVQPVSYTHLILASTAGIFRKCYWGCATA